MSSSGDTTRGIPDIAVSKSFRISSSSLKLFHEQGGILGSEPALVELWQEETEDLERAATDQEPKAPKFYYSAYETYTLPGSWSDGTPGTQNLHVRLVTVPSANWDVKPCKKPFASTLSGGDGHKSAQLSTVLKALQRSESWAALSAMLLKTQNDSDKPPKEIKVPLKNGIIHRFFEDYKEDWDSLASETPATVWESDLVVTFQLDPPTVCATGGNDEGQLGRIVECVVE